MTNVVSGESTPSLQYACGTMNTCEFPSQVKLVRLLVGTDAKTWRKSDTNATLELDFSAFPLKAQQMKV